MRPFAAGILFLIAACDAPAPPLLKPASPNLRIRVKSVYDGDTLTLENGQKVRLLAIDTPELKDAATGKPEPFAAESRDLTRRLCNQAEVRLEFDVEKEDRYGRLLCYVYAMKEGHETMVNAELLREGLARFYTPGANLKHTEMLLACQREARENGRGSWKDYVFGAEAYYVATPHGRAFHRKDCDSVKNSRTLRRFKDQREPLDEGLSPCRNCKP